MNKVSKEELVASFKHQIELNKKVMAVAEVAVEQLKEPETVEYWNNVKIVHEKKVDEYEGRIKKL